MKNKLTLIKKGENQAMVEETVTGESIVTVGSNPGATIRIDDDSVAPEQFVVIMTDGQFILLNSCDGTQVNQKELTAGSQHILSEGDRIGIAEYEVIFRNADLELVDDNSSVVPLDKKVVEGEVWQEEKATKTGTLLAEAVRKQEESRREEKDFSKVLHEIRDEDSFYFHLRDSEDVVERVPFGEDEIWIGTRLGNVFLAADKSNLDEVFCRVAKDWSGVVVFPRDDQEIQLNGKLLKKPERLKNGDTISLIDDFEEAEMSTAISFHEPVSLLALSSILPENLPAPVTTESPAVSVRKVKAVPISKPLTVIEGPTEVKLYIGYFTILEILVMAFGTIVTAAIIFFILEFV